MNFFYVIYHNFSYTKHLSIKSMWATLKGEPSNSSTLAANPQVSGVPGCMGRLGIPRWEAPTQGILSRSR